MTSRLSRSGPPLRPDPYRCRRVPDRLRPVGAVQGGPATSVEGAK